MYQGGQRKQLNCTKMICLINHSNSNKYLKDSESGMLKEEKIRDKNLKLKNKIVQCLDTTTAKKRDT